MALREATCTGNGVTEVGHYSSSSPHSPWIFSVSGAPSNYSPTAPLSPTKLTRWPPNHRIDKRKYKRRQSQLPTFTTADVFGVTINSADFSWKAASSMLSGSKVVIGFLVGPEDWLITPRIITNKIGRPISYKKRNSAGVLSNKDTFEGFLN